MLNDNLSFNLMGNKRKIFTLIIIAISIVGVSIGAYLATRPEGEYEIRREAQSGESFSWTQVNSLPESLGSYYGVTFDDVHDRVYVVGGYSSHQAHRGSRSVYMGTVQPDGNIIWKKQKDYPVSVLGAFTLTNGVRLYSFGGDDGQGNILSSAYAADIDQSTGDIGDWHGYQSLPIPLHFHAGLLYNNNILVLGGRTSGDEPTDAIYKRVGSTWEIISRLPMRIDSPAVAVYNGFIYVGGGQLTRINSERVRCHIKNVYYASISSDGNIGEWKETTSYIGAQNYVDSSTPKPDAGIKAYHHMIAYENYLYVLPAGSFAIEGSCSISEEIWLSSTLRSFRAEIKSDGSLGQWEEVGPANYNHDYMNWEENGMGTNVYGALLNESKMYIVGGMNYAGVTNAVYYMDLDVECIPDCQGKQCGDDGCGGSCGSCTGQTICQNEQCVCQPDCEGKQCGDDGCGGSCGSCPSGQICNNTTDQCETEQCTPDCTGKLCGEDNGCEGKCTGCPSGETCNMTTWQCESEIVGDIYDITSQDGGYDGIVDIWDLMMVINNYGWKKSSKDEKADINEDGDVNIIDVSLILNHWTKKY